MKVKAEMDLRTTLRQMRRHKLIYAMMIPVLLYFVVFSYYPLLLSFIQSLQENKLIGPPEFAGLQNYKNLFGDYQFWQAFVNSFLIGFFTQLFTFILALILALSLCEVSHKWIRTTIQTFSYLPNLFSWAVVGGLWITILSNTGLVNGILNLMGHKSVQFMAIPALAQPVMVLTAAWKYMGYYGLLFIASIVSIDGTVFEAAQIDGASRFRQLIHITLPELIPTMKVIILLGTMGLLQNFDQVFVMENSMILDKVRTLLLYIYNNGITQFKVGLATAGASVILVATLVMTLAVRKIIHYDENY